MAKLLFFDDRYTNVMVGMKRVSHSPRLVSEAPYVDPAISLVNLAWGYPFVYFNVELKKYIMLYQGWSIDRTIVANTIQLCAASEDGIHFDPMDTGKYFTEENKLLFNQVLPYKMGETIFAEGQFFFLPQLEGDSKFVALCMYKGPNNTFSAVTFISKDGLRFVYHPEMAWHQGLDTPDYPMSVVFNQRLESFVIYRRPRHTDRRIAFVTTKDFKHYSQPEVILQSDALDQPLTDFYGINVFPYADQFIGFLMVYQTPNYLCFQGQRVSSLPGHKFDGGKVEVQLVYSDGGVFFNRFFRTNFFIDPEEKLKCIYPMCVLEQNGKFLIYASATSEEHGRVTPGKGSILVFEMRKDGFCSLETTEGIGELTTKQFLYLGGDLVFNVRASAGYIKIQICDSDNRPIPGFEYENLKAFSGDSDAYVFDIPKAKMEMLKGKIIVLNILSTSANLYSIRGNLKLQTPFEAMKYEGR